MLHIWYRYSIVKVGVNIISWDDFYIYYFLFYGGIIMNEVMENVDIKIESLIYEIRGVQVMLDSDLAKLYNCKNGTKTINQAVRRHINRFPERFMFQLTDNEFSELRFQLGTTNLNMSRTLPYVFTEQGLLCLQL